jgi:hypothetical protein
VEHGLELQDASMPVGLWSVLVEVIIKKGDGKGERKRREKKREGRKQRRDTMYSTRVLVQ